MADAQSAWATQHGHPTGERATWLPDRAGAAPVRLTLPAPGSQSASQVMMAEWSSLTLTVICHGSLLLERELEFSGMKGDF